MSGHEGQPAKAAKTDINLDNTAVAFARMSDRDLMQAYWLFKVIGHPLLAKYGPRLAVLSLRLKLPIKPLVKRTVFAQFCGGESIAECQSRIGELAQNGIGTILDFASEGGRSESEFDQVVAEIKETIDVAAQNPNVPFAVFKPSGIARHEILEKKDRHLPLTAGEKGEYERIEQRFDAICSYAFAKDVRILVDAEETWIQATIDRIVRDLMRRFNRDRAIVYNTLQMYRKDRLDFLKTCYGDAISRNYKLGVKLVRGAYLEKETARAKVFSYRNPLHLSKEATDQDYNLALRYCAEHKDRIAVCAGTHNERSTKFLTQLMAEFGIARDDPNFSFAQLLGMSDHLTYNLVHEGYRVCKYVPYGPLENLLPYLARRAEENSSMKGQTSRELSLLSQELERRKLQV